MHLSKISLALRQWWAVGFSPLSLFSSGEQGAWYDPSDLSTMFQDSAGTTPVTADGQPVGLILDKSGRGNHASQPTAAARPLYKTDGTYYWLQFDGVDDALITENIDLTATDKITAALGFSCASTSDAAALLETGPSIFSTPGSICIRIASPGGVLYGENILVHGSASQCGWSTSTHAVNVKRVLVVSYDIAGTDAATEVKPYVNNVLDQTTLYASVNNGGNFSSLPLYIASRLGTSRFAPSKMFFIIIAGRLCTTQEIANLSTWINGKTGAY